MNMLIYIFCAIQDFPCLLYLSDYVLKCLSQDLETGCLKLTVVKFLGVHIFKGDHNILIFQP